jgi:perosamine synthetase
MDTYEARFSALFGPEYSAFSFWKGRVALYAILKAMEFRDGDEVILPAYTCVVVANAVRHAGAKPVYADITPGGYNLDPVSVSERVTTRTRALIVQHTYGIPADVAALRMLAQEHGLQLIEDCAHVLLGSTHEGQPLGSYGHAAFFSSQWSKPYTTGLGGVALIRDRQLAKGLEKVAPHFEQPRRLTQLQLQFQYSVYRSLFRPRLYWRSQSLLGRLAKLGVFVGSSTLEELTGKKPFDLNWRMGPLQKRSGLAQISSLYAKSSRRKALSKYYLETFYRHGWPVSGYVVCRGSTLLRFPIHVENKPRLLEESCRAGIELGSWFEAPLHPLPLADHHLMEYRLQSCPVAESTANTVVNLPLHEHVTDIDAERIAQFVLSHSSPAWPRDSF